MFQNGNGQMAVILLFVGIALAVMILINVFVCWLLQRAYASIPAEHRQMEPAMVWLLLIPCFNLIWNFMVFPKLGRSFRAYFESKGDTSHGDSGEKMGLWYAICTVCSIIPCVGYVAGPASLVLLIICLIKFSDLRNRVIAGS